MAAPLPQLRILDQCDSTNDYLAAEVARDPQAWPDFSALLARRQLRGRGRAGRTWISGEGALTFSILLRPLLARQQWGWLPLLAGAAVAQTLSDAAQPDAGVGVKWPNDVVHSQGQATVQGWGKLRKMSGVLTSVVPDAGLPSRADASRNSASSGARVANGGSAPDAGADAVIVGIGVNCEPERAKLPVPWAGSAAEIGVAEDAEELALAIRSQLAATLTQAQKSGGTAYMREIAEPWCISLGAPLEVELPSGELLTGEGEALADDGALVVRDTSGTLVTVTAGDVHHARLADINPGLKTS